MVVEFVVVVVEIGFVRLVEESASERIAVVELSIVVVVGSKRLLVP